ncbi:MAG: YceI family protein [Pyrinomonadaceae bacterium]|jgi:polyisoprenoid-binding protein YceI|nr:YceI family protein [Pyrinomonadaceae bacterium]
MLKRFSLALLLITSLATHNARAAAVNYEVDAAHSTVGFAVPILGGLSQVKGKFSDFTATIVYDEADITKSSVTATIKTASIDTGIERRDAHLRNADFFEVEKYPEITFQSKRVERRGKDFVAVGTFTMHGVSKEISVPFAKTGQFKNPANNKMVVGFSATMMINRRDYGITYSNRANPTFIGDEVKIELSMITKPSET